MRYVLPYDWFMPLSSGGKIAYLVSLFVVVRGGGRRQKLFDLKYMSAVRCV